MKKVTITQYDGRSYTVAIGAGEEIKASRQRAEARVAAAKAIEAGKLTQSEFDDEELLYLCWLAATRQGDTDATWQAFSEDVVAEAKRLINATDLEFAVSTGDMTQDDADALKRAGVVVEDPESQTPRIS